MFEESLVRGSKECLAVLGESQVLGNAYLAGGTACALQMGHRVSIDFDFFTPHEFDFRQVVGKMTALGSFVVEQVKEGTILGMFEGVKFSLFVYHYPLIQGTIPYLKVHVASPQDLGAMKIDAISSRGTKRDFVDLYFLCRNFFTLSEALRFYEQKYQALGSNLIHLKKSLVYFKDAEQETEMPKMLRKVTWDQIKFFFEQEVKKLIS